MRTHLKAKHHINLQKRDDMSTESTASSSSLKEAKNSGGTLHRFCHSEKDNSLAAVLARFASCDVISFNTICNSSDLREGLIARGFKDIPKSVGTVSKTVLNYGEKIRHKYKCEFKKFTQESHKFSLSLDEWTSVRNRRYLNLNVHSGKKTWNLGLSRINGSMPAEKCVEILDTKLVIFGLLLNHDIVAITTDGASVMKKVGDIIPADQQLCIAHGIQLAVVDVLYSRKRIVETEILNEEENIEENQLICSESEEEDFDGGLEIRTTSNYLNTKHLEDMQLNKNIGQLVEKIRKVVRMFRRSPTKNDALLQKHVKQEFGKELMLTLDFKTRWNSLLLMIERFFKERFQQRFFFVVEINCISSTQLTKSSIPVITGITGFSIFQYRITGFEKMLRYRKP